MSVAGWVERSDTHPATDMSGNPQQNIMAIIAASSASNIARLTDQNSMWPRNPASEICNMSAPASQNRNFNKFE
jgi:hypothetical protein